jgi:hypothetical protein
MYGEKISKFKETRMEILKMKGWGGVHVNVSKVIPVFHCTIPFH